jgi:hypothetical protein
MWFRSSLFKNKKPMARLVYGGKLVDEYNKNLAVRRMLAVLDRAGRTRRVDDDSIEKEIDMVTRIGSCISNDKHIIALARAGNVRLLCSHDKALHTDFTNKALLDKPRGNVYQNRRHKKLLERFCK